MNIQFQITGYEAPTRRSVVGDKNSTTTTETEESTNAGAFVLLFIGIIIVACVIAFK